MAFVERQFLVFVFIRLIAEKILSATALEWGRLKRDIMNSARFGKSGVPISAVFAFTFTQNLIGVMSELFVR